MMLVCAVAVIGPPAAGKTTLTMRLGAVPGCHVFRLREHVPVTMLAATATSAEQLGWIDDLTVTRVLQGYLASAATAGNVHTVLLDNFPGSATQAHLLRTVLRRRAPSCLLRVVELVTSPVVLRRRVRERRVCHQCERDPIRDPRLPAVASLVDPHRCARCNNILHPRRGDAPRLLAARMERYDQAAVGIRAAFANVGIDIVQLDGGRPSEDVAAALFRLLPIRSASL